MSRGSRMCHQKYIPEEDIMPIEPAEPNEQIDDESEDIMTFDAAFATLRSGTGARRESWEDVHRLKLNDDSTAIVDENGAEWTPTTADLFGDDWEVV